MTILLSIKTKRKVQNQDIRNYQNQEYLMNNKESKSKIYQCSGIQGLKQDNKTQRKLLKKEYFDILNSI